MSKLLLFGFFTLPLSHGAISQGLINGENEAFRNQTDANVPSSSAADPSTTARQTRSSRGSESGGGDRTLAGEASTSRRKRQRLPSIVGEETEPVQEEDGENGGGTASVNRSEDDGGNEVITTEVRSGMMFELDLLDCPVCCHALRIPIFQCDNGHIACSSCCKKLRNKCPACTLPIGNYRCRFAERVVEAIIVPCPNAKHGCTEKFSYGKELVHEKKCGFALCYCPAPNCNYTGVYKDLYSHYCANHKNMWDQFACGGHTNAAWLRISVKILVLQQSPDGPLVVIQCFREPKGVNVTVNCIAPCAPGVGKFSYLLSFSMGGKTMSFESDKMNRIQKVSFETPEEYNMFVPDSLLGQWDLKMNIRIRRIEEEKEAQGGGEEEEEEEEEE